MNSAAIITFLIVASFIWGGLFLIVTTAVRREAAKVATHAGAGAKRVPANRQTES